MKKKKRVVCLLTWSLGHSTNLFCTSAPQQGLLISGTKVDETQAPALSPTTISNDYPRTPGSPPLPILQDPALS
jgi:hypothetical protein